MHKYNRDLILPEDIESIIAILTSLEISKGIVDEKDATGAIIHAIAREIREGTMLLSHFKDKFLQNETLSKSDMASMLWHFGQDARDWLRDLPGIRVDPRRVPAENAYSLFDCIMVARHLTHAPGYDDVETLGIVRVQHNRYFVSIGDDSIEWYLQFKGLYPYSPRASLPDETTDLAPAALEACLGLWVTYFRRHGGNRLEMAQLLEALTRYRRKHPGTRGQMRDLARMRDNFARFGKL